MLIEGPQMPFARDKGNDSLFSKLEFSSNAPGKGGFGLNARPWENKFISLSLLSFNLKNITISQLKLLLVTK